MNSLRLDAATALRFFARRKTAFAVIVLSIALALAANVIAFSVVRAFLFAHLAVPQSDRVVLVPATKVLPGRGRVDFSDAFPNYRLLKQSTHSFSALGATLPIDINWEQPDETRRLQGARVTASFFDVMQVQPMLGRLFAANEEGPHATPVVLISHALWRSAFGGNNNVIGQVLRLNGVPHTITAVLPVGFDQPSDTDVWLPFDLPQEMWTKVTGARQITTYARLANNSTLAMANKELQLFAPRAIEADAMNKDWSWRVQPLRENLLNGSENVVLFVQTGAFVLLLLAICNLTSVLMAWAAERERETAVRLALGASSWRIIRQFLVQSLLLIITAGGVALLIAHSSLPLLQHLNPDPSLAYLLKNVRLDSPTISFAALLVLVTALVIGLLPALQLGSLSIEEALRTESRGASATVASVRWQKIMVIFQAGFSVIILICAALAALGFSKVSRVQLGFSDQGRVGFRIEFPEPAYATHEKRVQCVRTLEQNLAKEPALTGYGLTTTLPVGDIQWGGSFVVQLPTGEFTTEPVLFHFRRVSPGYLPTMGIPLLQGREFDATDRLETTPVAIVSKALADLYWPAQNAIGRKIRRVSPADSPVVEVVGVVGNVRDAGAGQAAGETVYVPFEQVSMRRAWVILRTRGSVADAIAVGRRALRLTAPDIAPFDVEKLESLSWQALALPRLQAILFFVFSTIAVAITALGTYGMMSQLVAIREKELAIRTALGATPQSLVRLVLWQNARLAVGGTLFGVVIAWGATLWLQSRLTNFESPALLPFIIVATGMIAVTQMASLVPARRAARLDLQLLRNG
jgi:putative ABC transport system permease protein